MIKLKKVVDVHFLHGIVRAHAPVSSSPTTPHSITPIFTLLPSSFQ